MGCFTFKSMLEPSFFWPGPVPAPCHPAGGIFDLVADRSPPLWKEGLVLELHFYGLNTYRNSLHYSLILVFVCFMSDKLCRRCGVKIPEERNSNARYCTDACSRQEDKEKWKKFNPGRNIYNRASTGSVSEMLVCADLLLLGFSVFRAVSTACSCDIICMTDGKTPFRVEVKTAYFSPSGKLMFAMPVKQKEKHDVLALVNPNTKTIEYRPPFPSTPPSGSKPPSSDPTVPANQPMVQNPPKGGSEPGLLT